MATISTVEIPQSQKSVILSTDDSTITNPTYTDDTHYQSKSEEKYSDNRMHQIGLTKRSQKLVGASRVTFSTNDRTHTDDHIHHQSNNEKKYSEDRMYSIGLTQRNQKEVIASRITSATNDPAYTDDSRPRFNKKENYTDDWMYQRPQGSQKSETDGIHHQSDSDKKFNNDRMNQNAPDTSKINELINEDCNQNFHEAFDKRKPLRRQQGNMRLFSRSNHYKTHERPNEIPSGKFEASQHCSSGNSSVYNPHRNNIDHDRNALSSSFQTVKRHNGRNGCGNQCIPRYMSDRMVDYGHDSAPIKQSSSITAQGSHESQRSAHISDQSIPSYMSDRMIRDRHNPPARLSEPNKRRDDKQSSHNTSQKSQMSNSIFNCMGSSLQKYIGKTKRHMPMISQRNRNRYSSRSTIDTALKLDNDFRMMGNSGNSISSLIESICVDELLSGRLSPVETRILKKMKDIAIKEAKDGNWEESRQVLMKVIKVQVMSSLTDVADLANSRYHLGVALKWLNRYKEAMVQFQEVLSLLYSTSANIDTAASLFQISIILSESGNYSQAIAYLELSQNEEVKVFGHVLHETSCLLWDFECKLEASKKTLSLPRSTSFGTI